MRDWGEGTTHRLGTILGKPVISTAQYNMLLSESGPYLRGSSGGSKYFKGETRKAIVSVPSYFIANARN